MASFGAPASHGPCPFHVSGTGAVGRLYSGPTVQPRVIARSRTPSTRKQNPPRRHPSAPLRAGSATEKNGFLIAFLSRNGELVMIHGKDQTPCLRVSVVGFTN